jgi:predicted RNA-binding Zn-ribbon protein involved in translation (DUF1610 family)
MSEARGTRRLRPSSILTAVHECPVCGAVELLVRPYATWPPPDRLLLVSPYEEQLGQPSYEVCPNCGFEFGNDDNPGTAAPRTFEAYRSEWEACGRPRFQRR